MALLLNECSIIRSNGRRWSKSFQTSLRFCSTGELSRRNDGVYVERIMLVMVCSFFALVRRVGSFDRLAQRSGCSAVRSFDCSVVWLCGFRLFQYSLFFHQSLCHQFFRLFFHLLPFYCHLYFCSLCLLQIAVPVRPCDLIV